VLTLPTPMVGGGVSGSRQTSHPRGQPACPNHVRYRDARGCRGPPSPVSVQLLSEGWNAKGVIGREGIVRIARWQMPQAGKDIQVMDDVSGIRVRANTLLRDTGRVLAGRRDAGAPKELPRHYGDILALYARASSLFDAMTVLLKRGYPEEAVMLGRALFTEALRLRELAEASENGRIALIAGWVQDSLTKMASVERERERRTKQPTDPTLLKRLEDLKTQSRTYMKRHGVNRARKFPREADMAAKQGLDDDVVDYVFSHEFVHGGFVAHVSRYKMSREGGDSFLRLYTQTHDPRAIAAVASFAAKYALLAHEAAGQIIGWDDEGRVSPLLAEAERLAV
jgi:hypothetical protein